MLWRIEVFVVQSDDAEVRGGRKLAARTHLWEPIQRVGRGKEQRCRGVSEPQRNGGGVRKGETGRASLPQQGVEPGIGKCPSSALLDSNHRDQSAKWGAEGSAWDNNGDGQAV